MVSVKLNTGEDRFSFSTVFFPEFCEKMSFIWNKSRH